MPTNDPQPGEFWSTSKGRTVEILARGEVKRFDEGWGILDEVDAIAYQFLGSSMVHLRSVSTLNAWTKVEFE